MKRNLLVKGVFLCLGLLLFIVPTTFAADGVADETVVIEAGETISDDYYVGASNFVLDGTIEGDLFVGGTSIVINGTVEGDLFAAGQSIIINGTVADDVRVAGSVFELSNGASIGGDLLFAGYALEAGPASTISQDVLFVGLQALLNGGVDRNVLAVGSSLAINGRVGGNVNAEVGGEGDAPPINPTQFVPDAPSVSLIPPGLSIGENAEIGGDLTYTSPAEASVPTDSVQGNTDFELQAVSDGNGDSNPNPVWQAIRRLIGLLVVGLLIAWRAPALFERVSNILQEKPLPSLGYGAMVYFGTPIMLFILIGVTIAIAALLGAIGLGNIGASLFWIIFASSILVFVGLVMVVVYITKLVVGYLIGNMILNRFNSTLAENPMWSMIIGVVLVVILISIPFLGSLANFIIAIGGVGVFFLMWRSSEMPTEKSPEAI